MRRNGFTLIELLVVIAIIAVLAAILFPVFTLAKSKGQQSKCMNNMMQIGKAIMAYADNNQGYIPYAYNTIAPGGWNDWDTYTWRQRIQPYIKSRTVLLCPVPVKDNEIKDGHFDAGTTVKDISHYGMNRHLSTGVQGSYPEGYCLISAIPLSSKTIMVSENADGDWSAEPWDDDGNGPGNGGFWPYHGDKNNMGGVFTFCDGHARFMTVAQTQAEMNGCKFYYWLREKRTGAQ